jgi:hypothetical protein
MDISICVLIFKLIATLLALLGKFKVRDFGRFCMEKGVHEVAVCTRWSKLLHDHSIATKDLSVFRRQLCDRTHSKIPYALQYTCLPVRPSDTYHFSGPPSKKPPCIVPRGAVHNNLIIHFCHITIVGVRLSRVHWVRN